MKKLISALALLATFSVQANTTLDKSADKLTTGMWGWANCTQAVRVFRYSPDKRFLKVTTERGSYHYYMVGQTKRGLELVMTRETRLDEAGNPVRWFVVMDGDDQFRWLRADRKDSDLRGPVTRCGEKMVKLVLSESKEVRDAYGK